MTQLETRTEPMVVNFGPHHPSMHGVLWLVVTNNQYYHLFLLKSVVHNQ